MRVGRRMVFSGVGRPLECWTGDVGDPGPGEAIVRTLIAGVCGTDAHRLAGDTPEPERPVTLGHEGIGEILGLGEGVETDCAGVAVHPGDKVYFSPSNVRTTADRTSAWPPPADRPSLAAYQDYATLPPGNAFHRIPDDTDPEAVIAFGCAMPTVLGGMARLGGVRPGQTVVIQGCGPVGLAVTVLASLALARQVIVIGEPPHRLEAAETLGATTTIRLTTTSVPERRARLFELTDGQGAEAVIECTGKMEAFAEGMSMLAAGGRYLILGIFSGHGTVPLDPVRLNNRSQSVIGSLGASTVNDFATTIQIARQHGERLGFPDLITHRFGLTQLENAIAAAGSGEAIKAVVIPPLDA